MPRNERLTPEALLQGLTSLSFPGAEPVSSSQLAAAVGSSLPTVKRLLPGLIADGRVAVTGKARATRYRPGSTAILRVAQSPAAYARSVAKPRWSAQSLALRERLSMAVTARKPVTYRRSFVDDYQPNASSLLPRELAEELAELGRLPWQLPAGTYARKVLEQLLIDLSWSSSRLEGNRYTLLDTAELFKSGEPPHDMDGVMLLNHKLAIEFMVDAVPRQGVTPGVIKNVHALLMQELLADEAGLGKIREKVVQISGTAYFPMQLPAALQETFERIVEVAQFIKNPVEAAFFLWVNLAYLQPFEDGNKRVSRLAANMPLMIYNQAPLSFLDVDQEDYALAMLGVYEFCDVSMAVDLFEWTYRRSQAKYEAARESIGTPDPFRARHRLALGDAVTQVVLRRKPMAEAIAGLGLAPEDAPKFAEMLGATLDLLELHNCARFRVNSQDLQDWIDAGRPC